MITGCDDQQTTRKKLDGSSDNSVTTDNPVTASSNKTNGAADRFVGRNKCAECHEEIFEAHSAAPHAHTFALTKDSDVVKAFTKARVDAGAEFGEYEYVSDDEGLAVGMPEKFGGRLFPLDFALGSGEHAVTLLTLLPEEGETIAIEHRMTWFRTGDQLRLTPGHNHDAPQQQVEHFGKIFRGEDMHRCISCHVTTGHIVGTRIHNLGWSALRKMSRSRCRTCCSCGSR